MPRILESSLRDVKLADDVVIIKPVNLYECELEQGVFVGPFVEIQRGVIVGARTRIQSHTFVCELVRIGQDCFIGHGVMFVNDLFRTGGPSTSPSGWQATAIGNHVSIGSNATILPVSICDHVVIGAGSVVTKSISRPGIYCGNPAKFLRERPLASP